MRNANGFGSIHCLDKTGKKRRKPWAVRITTGWENGVQQRRYLGYYKTQREALLALAEYHKGGIDLDMNNITLNDVFDMWIKRVENKGVSISVLRIHNMAKVRFGNLGAMKIKEIKRHHLEKWLEGIDLKPNSKSKLRSTLNQVFSYALDNDIILKNYATNLELNEKAEKVGKVFTTTEIETLWKHKDDKYVQQYLIMIYTGMRIGEMLAIKRDDINFEDSYIIGGLKTKAGKNRVIPIHKQIMPLILNQLGDNKYLVQSKTQLKPVSYTTLKRHYEKVNALLGEEHTPHDCRKTGVSLMHTNGIPMEVIRVIVGHSGKGVTEQVYLYKEPTELVDYINQVEIKY